MKRLASFVVRLVDVTGNIFAWFSAVMILLILFEVFMRYVLGRPPIFADEYAVYMLVALSFLGMAYTWQKGGHVRITALADALPKGPAHWLRLVTLIGGFIFTAALVLSSYTFLKDSFELHLKSDTFLRTPLQVPHMTLLIGFSLSLLVLLVEISKAVTGLRRNRGAGEERR